MRISIDGNTSMGFKNVLTRKISENIESLNKSERPSMFEMNHYGPNYELRRPLQTFAAYEMIICALS